MVSEKEKEELERLQKEEEERKKKLQLYVFVMRCIAYPFNAKQPTDMARRQQKVKSLLKRTIEVGRSARKPDLPREISGEGPRHLGMEKHYLAHVRIQSQDEEWVDLAAKSFPRWLCPGPFSLQVFLRVEGQCWRGLGNQRVYAEL